MITRKRIANIDCLIAEPDKSQATLQTVLCLHGIGGDDASFQPQLEGLSGSSRVVAWNMPGYRESAAQDTLTFKGLAQSLQALVAALDCGPVAIIGQSIGGMIAQEFYHRFPVQVSSLVLVATTTAFGGKDDTFRNAFLEARLKPLDNGKSMKEIAVEAMPSIVARGTSDIIVHAAIDSMAAVKPEVYREVLRCLVTFNRRVEYQDIACPVCIVSGSDDTNAPAATMLKMAEQLSNAEYHEISGAGHLVNLEKADEFNVIAKAFLTP